MFCLSDFFSNPGNCESTKAGGTLSLVAFVFFMACLFPKMLNATQSVNKGDGDDYIDDDDNSNNSCNSNNGKNSYINNYSAEESVK